MNVEVNPADYKILIVDDTAANVLLLQALLKKRQYQTFTAYNGTEGLRAVETVSPDLILLDIMMPDIDGYEVARQLKAHEVYQEIPIIFLTALNTSADIVKGFEVGGCDYVSKPFNKEELLLRIGHQISLIAYQRDIQRKSEELRETLYARDKLYSVIAHDLRAPMGSIKMMFNLLMLNITEEQIGKEMYEMLSIGNQTTEETFTLLDNLLKWTKCQIGRLKTVFQSTNLIDQVQDAIQLFTSMAALKDIQIETSQMPEQIEVWIDSDMVKTIMRNLLSNAVKYSDGGAKIIVSVEDNGTSASVHVQDFGKGIKEEDQSKLLNPATHFTTYGTNKEEGSGLGLLLCKDFAQKNGGEFWFKSTEGEGSTFSFSVPKFNTGEAAGEEEVQENSPEEESAAETASGEE